MAQVHHRDSLTRIQKARICSSLLHRIRIIQGQTSLNFSEPHFTESKDCVRETKDIINNIKEGLKRGCSDMGTRTREEQNKLNRDINPNWIEKLKKLKRYPISDDKQETRVQDRQKKITVQEIVNFYESGEKRERNSNVKLSQMFDAKEDNRKEVQSVRDVLMENSSMKLNKKRKRRKRKREDVEKTSSVTLDQSESSLKRYTHGDARPPKNKNRKNKAKNNRQKRPECAGDESDIEDEPSSRFDEIEAYPSEEQGQKPRKKRSRMKCPSSTSNLEHDRPRDIEEIVSSTIDRLNTVNESVQKVIEDSFSSGSGRTISSEKPTATNLISKSYTEEPSSSSLNWSTVTMSKSTVVGDSETSVINQATKRSKKKASVNRLPVMNKLQVVKPLTPPSPSPPSPPILPGIKEQRSMGLEEIIAAKRKKNKSKTVEDKIKEEVEKVVEVEMKKNNEVKVKEVPEPVSSLKKSSAKKKGKRKEHVNFMSTPELVPEYPSETLPLISKKSVKLGQGTAGTKTGGNVKKQIILKPFQEESATITNIVKKPIISPKRRINSDKPRRNSPKKDLPKVKSAGHLSLKQTDEPPSVKTVLREESKPRVIRKRSGSNHRSTSGNRKRSTSRKSKELKEIYQKVRSNTTNTIKNINEQMSSTLKESIAHLNEICSKVRTTLSDMERDEETYKRLKSKQSFDMSSEAGSVFDSKEPSLASIQANAKIENRKPATPKPHTYTVITPTEMNGSIVRLMSTVPMGGDNALQESPRTEITSEEKVKKRSKRRKKRAPLKPEKPSTPNMTPSKTKSGYVVKSSSNMTSAHRIPIWQRKPPSVIEEIQLTVKKQATKSQYREFLRTLKNIARKRKSQVKVMPSQYKEAMELQQDKNFNTGMRQRFAIRKTTDQKPRTVETSPSPKVCQDCLPGKCNCGVTVENTISVGDQRMQWMHVRSDGARKGIQSYDILDEITLKDLEPIQSEYPRKDHISDTETEACVQDTLLYKLLYKEDPKILESLLRCATPAVNETNHLSGVSKVKSEDRAKSASEAYKLYQQLELNTEKNSTVNLEPNKGSLSLTPIVSKLTKEKPKAMQTCPKEFNDEVVIPVELKPVFKRTVNSPKKSSRRKTAQVNLKNVEGLTSMRSKKRIEDKMKIIGKTSSMLSISRRKRKVKLKNMEPKMKMKKMLIMPVLVSQVKERNVSQVKWKNDKPTLMDHQREEDPKLTISEENKERISKMSRREVIRILKPHIFHNFQPMEMTILPVYPKYNHQNKFQKPERTTVLKSPTYKKIAGFLKDHDDECRTGKKLCRRCQMSMQSGDETKKNNTPKKIEPLSPRQLWKNKYKPTPAECLVNRVLGKNASKRRFEVVPPEDKTKSKSALVTLTPSELNKNAVNTRNKLKIVRELAQDRQPLLGQHLDDIIDSLEFKIVDALSNPKHQHTSTFSEIEHEIKSILNTINDLKEINSANIRENNMRFKSKTSSSLAESTEPNSTKSNTDTNLLQSKNIIVECEEVVEIKDEIPVDKTHDVMGDVIVEVDEKKIDENLDRTYCDLGKNIENVIKGLDAIIKVGEEEKSEEKLVESKTKEVEKVAESELSSECEKAITLFCEQIDEVMKNVVPVEDPNISTDNLTDFTDVEDIPEQKSDEYLTPFMRAVRSYRQTEHTQSFVDFLDKLTMLSQENVTVRIYPNMPMYAATVQHKAQVVEITKTYNQAIQYDESNAKTTIEDSCEVLSTNQWMQTEEVQDEEVEEVKDQLMQTSSTEEQFNEIEEYLDSLDGMPKVMLVAEKKTQIPDFNHACFAETSSKHVQVTERTSTTVGNQTNTPSDEKFNIRSSIECQVSKDNFKSMESVGVLVEAYEIRRESVEKGTLTDFVNMEKYTNNKTTDGFGGELSDLSFDEYPRNVYTDSYLGREKDELDSDSRLCDKRNSYPATQVGQNRSDIISLFESRCNATAKIKDFLEDGFGKDSIDSYDSMLARCASSENGSTSTSALAMDESLSNTNSDYLRECGDLLAVQGDNRESCQEEKLHKHLLHSVYGIVFAVMFLGINLNYNCCG